MQDAEDEHSFDKPETFNKYFAKRKKEK